MNPRVSALGFFFWSVVYTQKVQREPSGKLVSAWGPNLNLVGVLYLCFRKRHRYLVCAACNFDFLKYLVWLGQVTQKNSCGHESGFGVYRPRYAKNPMLVHGDLLIYTRELYFLNTEEQPAKRLLRCIRQL